MGIWKQAIQREETLLGKTQASSSRYLELTEKTPKERPRVENGTSLGRTPVLCLEFLQCPYPSITGEEAKICLMLNGQHTVGSSSL